MLKSSSSVLLKRSLPKVKDTRLYGLLATRVAKPLTLLRVAKVSASASDQNESAEKDGIASIRPSVSTLDSLVSQPTSVDENGAEQLSSLQSHATPAEAEPLQAEPHRIEEVQAEPLKAVQIQSEALKTEQVTVEPIKDDPSHAAPLKTAQNQAEDFFGAQELVDELSDPQAFGKSGEVWFFAQLATIALIIFPPIPLKGLVDFLGVLALTSGLVFIAYALMSLGRNLSPMPKPRKKHSLVTTGMYSYLRHPMYGGLILATLGLAAVTKDETRVALAALLWLIFERKTAVEEKELIARYPQYEEYRSKVKKYIPFIY